MRVSSSGAAAAVFVALFACSAVTACGSSDEPKASATGKTTCTPLPKPTAVIAPSTVPVRVFNASDTGGLAQDIAIELRARQFRVLSAANYTGDATPAPYAMIIYGSIGRQVALTLAQQIKNPQLVEDNRVDPSVDLVLGTKFALIPVPPPAPSRVQLNVYNTTAITGLASDVANQLTARGFKVLNTGNDPAGHFWPNDTAVILYGKAGEPYARRVALQIKGSRMVEDDRSGTVVDLTLGVKWDGLVPVAQATPKPSPSNSSC